MCFAFDARPPELPADLALAPVAGGAGAELLELTSADGTVFSAALAQAPNPSGPAVVILPDVRGLYRFYRELAERFSDAGHHAIAIDYFGRSAGLAPRDEDFEFMRHIAQTTPQQIQADTATAIAALRDRTGEQTRAVTVGFCFGGSQSLLAATNHELALDGTVAFYGALDGTRLGIPSPPDHVNEMRGPILGLYGGADPGIPTDQIDTFDRALSNAGVEHQIITYPDAPHSFFDRSYTEHTQACDNAWHRVLTFLDKTTTARTA